jgi:Protein of unknown function (DUF2939)
MGWAFRIGVFVLLAWTIFMVSPFLALARLSRAVESRDIATVDERVDFRAVRLSLTKQILSEYMRSTGRGQELTGFSRNAAMSAGATLADPLVAQFLTPEALDRLMRGSLPPQVGGETAPDGLRLDLTSLDQAWRTFIGSESRGFTNLLVPVPPDRTAAEQYRLHLRLKGLTWRLQGIELPASVVQDLANKLPRSTS